MFSHEQVSNLNQILQVKFVYRYSGDTARLSMNNNIKLISIYIMMMFAISACNTIEGAGKDVESVGNEIENSAD